MNDLLYARRAFLLLSTVLWSGLAAPAIAQTVPPFRNLDQNGVDLTVGDFVMNFTEGSIGSGQAELPLIRRNNTNNPSQWDAYFFKQQTVGGTTTYTIGQVGGYVDTFTGFVANKANGATLSGGSSNYLYTAPDGTKVTFVDPSGGDQGYTSFCGSLPPNQSVCAMMPSTITSPDGRVTTLAYQYYTYPGPPYGTQPTTTYSSRLKNVSNTLGYSITFGYSTIGGGGGSSPPPASWYQRLSAKFFNTTISTTTPQATIGYAYPGSDTTDITDFAGNVWEVTSTSIKRPGETSPSFTVGGSVGAVSSVTADGITTNYAYSVSGTTGTMVVTDALSNHTTIVSDLNIYRPTTITDALGKTVTNSYDAYGRLTQVTQPEGNYINYTLDARGNATTIAVYGKTGQGTPALYTTANYDTTCSNPLTCNQPNSVTTPSGLTTNYTYDPSSGQVSTVTLPAPTAGANSPQKRYSYTATGGIYLLTGISECQTGTAPSCVGTADEVKTTIGRDANGNATTISKGAGDGSLVATTAMTYTGMGDVLTIDGPLAGTADTTTYRYDAARRQVGAIDPDPDGTGPLTQSAVRTTYDPAGRVTEVELGTVSGTTDSAWSAFASAQQQTISYANNQPSSQTATAGGTTYAVTQYSYDADGRSDCVATRMNSATWGTATPACSLQATGGFGPDRITRRGYDADGRINKTTSAYGTADQSDDATATFSDNGRVATLTDAAANKTTYVYDRFDRLSQTQFPVATQGSNQSDTNNYEVLTYDTEGRVTNRRLRSGSNLVFTYDNLGRVATLQHTDNNSTVTYTYNLVNQLIQLSRSNDPAFLQTNGYDALGRLVTEGQPFGTTSYLYDAAGNRTRITWGDGFYAGYVYNTIGNVTSINENGATSGVGVLATYSYDNLGRRTGVAYGNGTSRSYAYDPVGRLAGLQLTFPNSPAYNELIGGVGGSGTPIGYTPSSQIASITRSNDAYAWQGEVAVTRPYTTNGLNQYTQSGGTTLGYDAQGNLNLSGTTSYGYDALNRLCCLASGETIGHDPTDRIAVFYVNASNRTNLYYAGPDLIAEWTTGPITNRYVPGPGTDEPIAWYQGSDTSARYFLQADERGSVIAVSNSAGTVTNVNSYDEFGIPATSNVGRYQYTGQLWSPDVGMYWYKTRWYSPTLGRFMQTDPIGYGDGMNWYNYAHGDPINGSDPSGLAMTCVVTNNPGKPFSTQVGDYPMNSATYGGGASVTCTGAPDPAPNPGGGGGGGGKPSPKPMGPQSGRVPNNITCGTVLPNGRTVGSYVHALSNKINSAGNQSVSTPYGPTSAYTPGLSPLSIPGAVYSGTNFRKMFGGPGANYAFLGDAGNFAYAAVSGNIGVPLSVTEAAAGAYSMVAHPSSDWVGPYNMDPSATVQVPAGYGAGC